MSTATPKNCDVVTASIRLLVAQGYHSTTVDRLAKAAGVSRATFFRKYGSKEDVVFADHASNLERLEQLLSRPNLSVQAGLAEGVQLVFRHNLDHAGRAVDRHRLLQQVPELRDRELATSHQYERLFQGFLREVLPDGPDRRVTAVALASATVAVHNAFLRTWLRDPGSNSGEQLAAGLNQRIGWLCTSFGVAPGGTRGPTPARTVEAPAPAAQVVVVVREGVEPQNLAESTARAVREALLTGTDQSMSRSETRTP